ncbi:NADP-dependent 3-hydroxy acid dehydrogenase YdfG [Nocardioides ginsengisegetis]|uniref:NADP-dependent 3-hydroxy acid dehydrogenase YdfG n=1 Tax=Nocardioides ginsengisegetis TaxID=661491 RepID=A0A7W3IWG6_9ACTN|nr:SDR family oxidoreductase [Nocardioides ginsengisegetis]MBA8801888.1 NADP-dependent 3-hydroxy acid dehydrogenase YdfG [Nocardioides ginsengisegetis]
MTTTPATPVTADRTDSRTAVVTGASSGIGAATARALAAEGFRVVCAARRRDRIEELAAEIGGVAVACDVTDPASVAALAATVGEELSVLVNNAGGAFGSGTVETADPADWRAMYEVNVLGVLHVTQALLPALRASGDGLIVNVGSTAGRIAYEGGGGYTAAKHGTQVVTETLRLELCGEPIRVSEIAPGMVRTDEFSLVRFDGDQAKADAVYAGVPDPLVAEDVADAISWIATRPSHVNIDELVIRPRAQAAQHKVHRVS